MYSHQAITARKTIHYATPIGSFNYRSLKPELFLGYQVIQKGKLPVIIAEIEKALLDYLYLTATLKTGKDIESLRLNYAELQNKVNCNKLENYALIFGSKTLDKRIKYLKKLLSHAIPV